MKKIPNLDTLRFIAASLVIIHHIELYKSFFNLPNLWNISFFEIVGKLGVVLFFVLSGFLITTLLLNEQEKKGDINFKNFYIRRILRIWPLYYIVVIVGFLILPHINLLDIPNNIVFPDKALNLFNFTLYLTIFANLGWAIFRNVPFVSQTWSVSTEEQFYIFWPWVIKYCKKILIPSMILIIVGYWLIKYGLEIIPTSRYITARRLVIASHFIQAFNINCMAIGGLFAVLIYKKKYTNILINNKLFIFISLLTIILLISGVEFGFFHYDIYALLFAYIITNLSFNTNFKNLLENKVTNYFGQLSYGMYMLHGVPLILSIQLSKYVGNYLIIYPLTFILTLTLSHFSFNYFEKYFLKLKDKFN